MTGATTRARIVRMPRVAAASKAAARARSAPGLAARQLLVALAVACAGLSSPPAIRAVEKAPTGALEIQLLGVPERGSLFFRVYDDPDSFGDFREPAHSLSLPADGDGVYRLESIPAGEIALLVFADENDNGVLDRNFIGIPREPIALSNGYRPKGPPSFERARFELRAGSTTALDLELFRVLGRRGQIGAGVGVIARTSPYADSTDSVTRVIPALTYIGERLQWLGPEISYGLLGSDRTRLALTATYRIGPYEEADSPRLLGLGDRDDTLMLGAALQYELPNSFEIDLAYRHDVLDRVGGGEAEFTISRGFQRGAARLSPQLFATWLSSDVSRHDFGVPLAAETADRPAYDPGSALNFGVGVDGFFELSERWRAVANVRWESLDDGIRSSPIVDEDSVFGGFLAIAYLF